MIEIWHFCLFKVFSLLIAPHIYLICFCLLEFFVLSAKENFTGCCTFLFCFHCTLYHFAFLDMKTLSNKCRNKKNMLALFILCYVTHLHFKTILVSRTAFISWLISTRKADFLINISQLNLTTNFWWSFFIVLTHST